jgi:hypothetical protein
MDPEVHHREDDHPPQILLNEVLTFILHSFNNRFDSVTTCEDTASVNAVLQRQLLQQQRSAGSLCKLLQVKDVSYVCLWKI